MTGRRRGVEKQRSTWWATGRTMGLCVLVALVFRAFVAEAYVIPSGSMEPTLLVGDRLVVNKASFGLRIPWTTHRLIEGRAPRRGEVVIFIDPQGSGETLIKRVIGVAGDTVSVRQGRLHLNGVPVPRRFIGASPSGQVLPYEESLGGSTHRIYHLADRPARDFAAFRVPPDHAFVMGDNRDDSNDSRYWGPLPCSHLKGKALAILWSFEDGPRWGRFFTAIR